VLVRPSNGEPLHPGEYEQLKAFKAAQQDYQRRLAQAQQNRLQRQAQDSYLRRVPDHWHNPRLDPSTEPLENSVTAPSAETRQAFHSHENMNITTYSGASGKCKCNKCKRSRAINL